jgi:NADPH:quinone reductase-like Zn-dependent oxidoreductase
MSQLQTGILLLVGLLAATGAKSVAGADAPLIPSEMRAAAIDRAGGPEVLTLRTLPVPQPDADEVLIAVHTAGVASWDVAIRRHPDGIKNSRFPLVLGTDGSGLVAAVGSRVTRFKVGDPVYTYSWDNPKGGFYAEYAAVPAERVGTVPKGLSLTQAGAIGTTALTAIQGTDDALDLHPGEALLIHGAAGGVGTLAVQFAKRRGAKVLATITAEDERGLVERLGADAVVDTRHGNLADAVRVFAPAGLDAVLALAGGDALERCIELLKSDGRVAYPSGVQPPKPRAGLRILRYDAIAGPKEFERLNAAIEKMRLEVPIAAQFPLSAAAEAQKRVEAGHVAGKVVLQIR